MARLFHEIDEELRKNNTEGAKPVYKRSLEARYSNGKIKSVLKVQNPEMEDGTPLASGSSPRLIESLSEICMKLRASDNPSFHGGEDPLTDLLTQNPSFYLHAEYEYGGGGLARIHLSTDFEKDSKTIRKDLCFAIGFNFLECYNILSSMRFSPDMLKKTIMGLRLEDTILG